jgi:hypothetical protein
MKESIGRNIEELNRTGKESSLSPSPSLSLFFQDHKEKIIPFLRPYKRKKRKDTRKE